tara:strand:- start:176 stop:1036 length:861 start_codon:yes stop_codon:yes gene_type:complete
MKQCVNTFRYLFIILIFSCSSKKTDFGDKITLDCIQTEANGIVPEDLYWVGTVLPTNLYSYFTKKVDVCGITLIAGDEISDSFMENIAQTISEIFIINEHTDTLLQEALLTNLYLYKTVIPLYYGDNWTNTREVSIDELGEGSSVCDIIMEDVPNPVMEVLEHILHHITNIGLHYTFPIKWGLSNSSQLFTATQQAISLGHYDVKQYSDIRDLGIRNRVILQEYAYWIIYTAWDLRENYGPDESEWYIHSSDQLISKLPDSHTLFKQTIPSVISCPTIQTLNLFLE